jgi:hypothetical protein
MQRQVENPFAAKWRQMLYSRKVWAGLLGLVITMGLWALGEIDGAQAVAALAWVLGIFIGAVAVEDGLRNVLTGVVEPVAVPPVQVDEEEAHGVSSPAHF